MGKIGGSSSWLTAVKKAFRSPIKDDVKRSSRRREEQPEQEEEEKRRGKRRWIFRKPLVYETTIQHSAPKNIATIVADCTSRRSATGADTDLLMNPTPDQAAGQRRALAVAMASTAAAEAAVATAQAAVEVIRLARPSIFAREHYAAITIQTAFRGYLARRALRALKGLVKLQALVRGHNVRKRAKMTLQCMQALVRVQDRLCDQRKRLSCEGSMEESNSLDSPLANRKPISKDGSGPKYGSGDRPHTVKEIQSELKKSKEAAIKREQALSYAFSHQMWRSGKESCSSIEELEELPKWLDYERIGRISCDQRDPVKIVEIDTTSQPHSYSAPNAQRSQKCHHHSQQQNFSPLHRAQQTFSFHSTNSPSPILKPKRLLPHSVSPRCPRQDRYRLSVDSPKLSSIYRHETAESGMSGSAAVPNYMAATASAKARVRSQSAPRQRPLTPEREKTGSAKKRLSFPAPDPHNDIGVDASIFDHKLRSPSRNSTQGAHPGMEQRSSKSFWCPDGIDDDISTLSTSNLRRWLK